MARARRVPEGMLKEHDGYKQNDHVIVTDDSDDRSFGHRFQRDEELILLHFDPADTSWWVHAADESVDEANWIAEDDFTLLAPPATKKEIDAAIKSILSSA